LITALLYHHCREIEFCQPEIYQPRSLTKILDEPECSDDHQKCFASDSNFDFHEALDLEPAYAWLAERTGFWPAWLAVGRVNNFNTLDMAAGYRYQFKNPSANPSSPRVLFSWSKLEPIFLDYDNWHFVLNSIIYPGPGLPVHTARRLRSIPKRIERSILRPGWSDKRWLQSALGTGSVQAVTPGLNLASADSIRCPDQASADLLEERGFSREQLLVRSCSGRVRF